jgi:hypothetical protein
MLRKNFLKITFYVFLILVSFYSLSLKYMGTKKKESLLTIFSVSSNTIEGQWCNEYNDNVYFFEDNTFTAIVKDSLIIGTYNKENEKIKFQLFNSEPIETKLYLKNKKAEINFDGYYFTYQKINDYYNDNPFHLGYQNWRIKPKNKEQVLEVKKRVLNYLKFLKAKFDWGNKHSLDVVPQDKLSPLMFSSNGVWFSDKTLKEWKNIFYDDENWLCANQILIKNLPKEYKFSDKINFYENYKNILDLYIKNIKENKQ